VAFQSISMGSNRTPKFFEASDMLQHADSAMQTLVHVPKQFELELSYRSHKRATLRLEFLRDHQEAFNIQLPPSAKNFRQVVELPSAGIYRLGIAMTGKKESYTVWKRIAINLPRHSHSNPSSDTESEEAVTEGFSKPHKPDILLYVVDTLRADHLGCYGYERNTSLQLDRMAEESTVFQNAYTTASWTKPGGASIITGLLPKNHKVMAHDDRLSDKLVTLAEVLRGQGYYTVGFVTNFSISSAFGYDQGYDLFREFIDSRPVTQNVQSDEVNETLLPFLRDYLSLEERKPLFLLVWTLDPHDPYTPPDELKNLFGIEQFSPINTDNGQLLYKIQSGEIQPTVSQVEFITARYDQEILLNDRSFGQVLELMKELRSYDDAVIVFTSDHGEEFFEHGGVGHGRTLYNELVRVPLVIKAGRMPRGKFRQSVQYTDIYPTILDIVGASAPYQLDGVSLLQESDPARILFFEERLDDNEVYARLDAEKKLIINRRYHRPPSPELIPVFELFAREDLPEQHRLKSEGLEDEWRRRDLLDMISQESALPVKRRKVDMKPDVIKHLKDLGYIK